MTSFSSNIFLLAIRHSPSAGCMGGTAARDAQLCARSQSADGETAADLTPAIAPEASERFFQPAVGKGLLDDLPARRPRALAEYFSVHQFSRGAQERRRLHCARLVEFQNAGQFAGRVLDRERFAPSLGKDCDFGGGRSTD